MYRIPVASRMIKAIYYSQEDGGLRLCFANGEERRFTDVSYQEVSDMVLAPSPGQHYLKHGRRTFRRAA